jgi:site-specific DNA-methyltransferase (cytosine-N4-specific)
MYSVYGDTVLDPFCGTGTTSLAAMVAARDSIGNELVAEFAGVFDDRADDVLVFSRNVARQRLAAHREFVDQRRADGESLDYRAVHYDFPVTTRQERRLRPYAVDDVQPTAEGYRAHHSPVEDAPETDETNG